MEFVYPQVLTGADLLRGIIKLDQLAPPSSKKRGWCCRNGQFQAVWRTFISSADDKVRYSPYCRVVSPIGNKGEPSRLESFLFNVVASLIT